MGKPKKKTAERFCFVQDESSHWYMIPVDLRERFIQLRNQEAHDDLDSEFTKYLTGGGVGRFSFVAPQEL